MKEFYDALVGVADKEGYELNYEKEEAYSASWMGQFGDSHKERKSCYTYYWNDRDIDQWEETFKSLIKKGYNIKYNFHKKKAFLGNIVVEVDGKWFAIGECGREVDRDGLYIGLYYLKIWSPKYVLKNIKNIQTQLRDAMPISYVP
jgi:hypothetical protein